MTVEKTPMCAMAGRVDLVSTERMLGNWPRTFDDAGACGGCVVRPWCDGLDPGYVSHFGFDGIQRLERVPATALEGCLGRKPEFLKMHCVRAATTGDDDGGGSRLSELAWSVAAQHGRLAVFRSEDVDDGAGGPVEP